MNTSLFKYLMLSMFSLVFFCTCDKDDELSGEEFRVTMENRFFSIKTSKTFTKKDGSTEIMQEGKSYLADSPSTIWFHDSKLYIPIQISSKDTLWQKWNAYQREKGLGNILLLVGHKYMYESQGNGLITPDQLLVHEQLGGRFYLKTDGDNLLHATILYPDDIADDDTIFPKVSSIIKKSYHLIKRQLRISCLRLRRGSNSLYHRTNEGQEAFRMMLISLSSDDQNKKSRVITQE